MSHEYHKIQENMFHSNNGLIDERGAGSMSNIKVTNDPIQEPPRQSDPDRTTAENAAMAAYITQRSAAMNTALAVASLGQMQQQMGPTADPLNIGTQRSPNTSSQMSGPALWDPAVEAAQMQQFQQTTIRTNLYTAVDEPISSAGGWTKPATGGQQRAMYRQSVQSLISTGMSRSQAIQYLSSDPATGQQIGNKPFMRYFNTRSRVGNVARAMNPFNTLGTTLQAGLTVAGKGSPYGMVAGGIAAIFTHPTTPRTTPTYFFFNEPTRTRQIVGAIGIAGQLSQLNDPSGNLMGRTDLQSHAFYGGVINKVAYHTALRIPLPGGRRFTSNQAFLIGQMMATVGGVTKEVWDARSVGHTSEWIDIFGTQVGGAISAGATTRPTYQQFQRLQRNLRSFQNKQRTMYSGPTDL